jgi:hypothetical protein
MNYWSSSYLHPDIKRNTMLARKLEDNFCDEKGTNNLNPNKVIGC